MAEPSTSAGGGFKLTFKLNNPSSAASPSSNPVRVSSPQVSASPFNGLESSPAPSDAPSSVVGNDSAVAGTDQGLAPKPKKKRASAAGRKGEAGPGKHWRKGLKGNITGGVKATEAPPGVVPGAGVAKRASAATNAASKTSNPIAYAPKVPANSYLPTQPFDAKTPATRHWTARPRQILNVTGMMVELRTWFGEPKSVFAESISARRRDEAKAAYEAEIGIESALALSPGPAGSGAAPKKRKKPRASATNPDGTPAPAKKRVKKEKPAPAGEAAAAPAATTGAAAAPESSTSRANSLSASEGIAPSASGFDGSASQFADSAMPSPKAEQMDVDNVA